MSKTTTSWSLQEKIRLLELFMNKDILWEQRVIILQKEFAQRPATFFSVQNVRQELHQIFMSPNPEHVYGLPLHSRGKEAAEMWVKHFRKEQIKQRELQKQMFLVSMRRQLDLIKRFQQGKLPSKEIEAILTETRERDAQLPERDLYESAVAQTLNKLRLDDLNNIRSFADYYSFLRGERVPTPSPEPLRLKSSTPVRLTTASIASSELVLKDIKNNASSTVQHKEKSPSSNTSSTCTFFGNSKQNEQVPELGDFLDDEEEKEEENKTNNDNNCSLEIKNQVIALNKEDEINLNKVAKRTIILEKNNDVVFDGEEGTDIGESPDKSNIFAEEIEEDNETIKSVQRKDLILNEEEINILLSEDGDNSIKIIDKSSIKVRVDDELEGDDENIKNNQNSKGKSNSVEDNELIIENIDKGNDDKNCNKNDLVEKIIEECFEECFNEACLRKTEKTEKTVAEMIWSCSSIEYAQLSTFESTIKKMNQTFQLVKNMDGQESNSFVENICKIAQFDSVEEKIVLLPSNQSNSLEEPMTSVKAAHIISSEIEVANSIKEQQLKRQQRNKTLPKKLQQKLPLITKPSLSRNLRSSTTKKKEEKEEVLITTEELEGINQNIEVEEVTPPPPSAVIVGSKKRKRTEIDLLKPPLQPDNVEQQPEGVGGPPAKNLRRSSYSSPFSHSSESKSSLVTKKEVQKESISSVSDVVKSQPILSPIEQEAPILPIKPIPSPLQLSIQPLHSHVAATAKLRSSLRRAALASSTPSPAVDSVGTNGLFLRPGNHSSTEIIPKQVLLTLLRDISSHRHCYIFEKPVEEEEVPGYHSAIKKPMDLQTLHQLIESCAIQTFGQFTHHILLIYANAVMYNSTGHHVNTCAKEMLDFAFKCIEVVQYPSGQWPPPLHIPATPALATSVSRQSIASESDGPNDGQLSRSSSGISCSQIPSTSNTTTKTLASTQQKILRSSSTSKGNKIKSINSSASSSASSYSSETKKEQEDQERPSIPKIEVMTKKITGSSRRKLHR